MSTNTLVELAELKTPRFWTTVNVGKRENKKEQTITSLLTTRVATTHD